LKMRTLWAMRVLGDLNVEADILVSGRTRNRRRRRKHAVAKLRSGLLR
jgi:hypothetical protein